MNYPSMKEVNNASHEQLGRWSRFLPSPGLGAVDTMPEDFELVLVAEGLIMDKILARFKLMGGWNPQLSKLIGWDSA